MVRTKVFVGNLSFQTQEAELATEFAAAGKVISANIITRGPRSLGYGFVEMDSEEDANNAVKLMNKKEIHQRQINVEVAKPQDETREKQPRREKTTEEGSSPARRRPRRRAPKKYDDEDGSPAQRQHRDQKEEQDEDSERPRRNRRRAQGTPGLKRIPNEENREESKTTLFVANLPFGLDDEAFGKVVTELGLKLKSAHVVVKKNGRSKGYGFVDFDSTEDQQKALAALNKKVVDNRELSVKVALTEIRTNSEEDKSAERKPAEKRAAPAEKKTAPAEKGVPAEKGAPADKKPAQTAEKKTAPAEKKVVPAEKKVVPAEKKTASPAPAEKKTASPAPAEKKTASPAPAEKKTASPATPDKKPATPEKKEK